jgi:hypothetical protein
MSNEPNRTNRIGMLIIAFLWISPTPQRSSFSQRVTSNRLKDERWGVGSRRISNLARSARCTTGINPLLASGARWRMVPARANGATYYVRWVLLDVTIRDLPPM